MSFDVSIVIQFISQIQELDETILSLQKAKSNLAFEIIAVRYVKEEENFEITKQYEKEESIIKQDGKYDYVTKLYEQCDNICILDANMKSSSAMFNLAATVAVGKYIFFTDTNNNFSDYWIDGLVELLELKAGDAVIPAIKDNASGKMGYGATWNEKLDYVWLKEPETNGIEIPFVLSYAFLIKSEVFKAISGFNENFKSKGLEDHEFSIRLWLFGYKIIMNKNVIINRRMKCQNYFDTKLYDIVYNYIVCSYSHFNFKRFSKVIEMLSFKSCFNNVAAQLFDNDNLLKLRGENFKNRKFDDNYFFDKFDIPF